MVGCVLRSQVVIAVILPLLFSSSSAQGVGYHEKDVEMCQADAHSSSSWSIALDLKAHSFLLGTAARDAPELERPRRRPSRTQSYLGRIVEGTLDCSLWARRSRPRPGSATGDRD